MNKNVKFIFLLLFIFTFISTNVFAKEVDIKVTDIKIVDKSDNVIADDPIISDDDVNLSATFNEKDDFVTYELTIKNTDSLKWKIQSITDNNELDNLKIDYDYEDNYIDKNGTSKVKIKLTYKDKLINTESINISSIAITLDLLNESGKESNIVINNPITHDGILKYLVLLIISVTALICKKTRKRFKKLKVGNFLILIAIIMSPFMIFAEEKISLNLNVQNIVLKSEMLSYNVVFNSNGGSEVDAKTLKYWDKVGDLPTTTRSGYEFDGWYQDLDFTIEVTNETVITGDATFYAKWNKVPFVTVFSHEGACTFNGANGVITGSECSDYAGQKYIDTGVYLYNDENHLKDYEIYFEIDEFDKDNQDGTDKPTFFSTKYETNNDVIVPGVVVREKSGSIEISESVNGSAKTSSMVASNVKTIKIVRKDNKTYYSFNDATLSELCDLTGFDETFDLPAVFGAALNRDGTPFRYIKATVSNMYIKLGEYADDDFYTITFNPNGGTVGSATKLVKSNEKLGNLPSASLTNYYLDGWYTTIDGGEKIISDLIPNNNVTYYAHWKKSFEAAILENEKLIFNLGTTKKINITNESEIEEEYTFTSGDTNIATVDNLGNVSGISEGETTVTVKGKKSGKTKKVSIKINDGKSVVTFDTTGGNSLDELIVNTNSAVGELPTPIRPEYKFDGWYEEIDYINEVTSSTIVDDDVTYYAKWTKKELTTVFSQEGACKFNGKDGVIEGEECSNYAGEKYIDTGISLYNSENYNKDFEITFEIDEYDPNNQDSGSNQIFMNSKLENSSSGYPGIVFRRISADNLEISQTIQKVKVSKSIKYSEVNKVRILRDNNIIYYSINNSELVKLQDVSDLVQYFDTTVWFGAAPDSKGNAFRYIKATISNIKIKLAE